MSRAEGESARDSERSEAESLVAFGAEGPGSICHRPQHGDRVRAPRLKEIASQRFAATTLGLSDKYRASRRS